MDTFSNPIGVEMAPGGTHGLAKFQDDKNLLVLFYNRAVDDPVESAKRGRRFTRNQVYVKIQHPGEVLNIIDKPATDSEKFRFREQWSRFVANRSQVPDGTPIDMLFPNHPAVGENLRAMGVYTIEQCAALSANAIDTIGRGAQEYVNRAQKYLENASSGAAFTALQRELELEKQKTASLEHQMVEMKKQLDHFMMRHNDPIRGAEQPPFVEGHDVQAERINANHVTKEIAKTKRKTAVRAPIVTDQDAEFTDPLAGTENAA